MLPPELIGFVIDWRPLVAGVPMAVGEVVVHAHPTRHLESLERSFGTRYPGTSFEAFCFVLEGRDSGWVTPPTSVTSGIWNRC